MVLSSLSARCQPSEWVSRLCRDRIKAVRNALTSIILIGAQFVSQLRHFLELCYPKGIRFTIWMLHPPKSFSCSAAYQMAFNRSGPGGGFSHGKQLSNGRSPSQQYGSPMQPTDLVHLPPITNQQHSSENRMTAFGACGVWFVNSIVCQ